MGEGGAASAQQELPVETRENDETTEWARKLPGDGQRLCLPKAVDQRAARVPRQKDLEAAKAEPESQGLQG